MNLKTSANDLVEVKYQPKLRYQLELKYGLKIVYQVMTMEVGVR